MVIMGDSGFRLKEVVGVEVKVRDVEVVVDAGA